MKRIIFFICFFLTYATSCAVNSIESLNDDINYDVKSIADKTQSDGSPEDKSTTGNLREYTAERLPLEKPILITSASKTSEIDNIAIPPAIENYIEENIISPWTKEEISNIYKNWKYASEGFIDNFLYYYFDFTDDGVPELIIRVEHMGIFINQKTEDGYTMFPCISAYGIGNGTICIPPVYPNSEDEKLVFPKHDDNNFSVVGIIDDKFYLTGCSFIGGNSLFWINQIIYKNNEFIVENIYYWGYFREMVWDHFEFNLHYRKYYGSEFESNITTSTDYVEVSPEEIENFLEQIYGDDLKISN